MRQDDKIQNLVSKLKSITFNPFWQKKTVEIWQIWLFCQFLSVFDSFLAKRGVGCYLISILRQELKSPHPGVSF